MNSRRLMSGILAAAVALAGCSSSAAPRSAPSSTTTTTTNRPVSASTTPPSGQRVRLTVSDGCPRSVEGDSDVVSTYGGPGLVPANPLGGIICQYQPVYRGPAGSVPHQLGRQVRLDRAQTAQLAQAIRRIDLSTPTGAFSCPATTGAVSLIGFSYESGPDIGLWYAASGCRTLDNGRLRAFEGTNPSFYRDFESALDALAPPLPLTQ